MPYTNGLDVDFVSYQVSARCNRCGFYLSVTLRVYFSVAVKLLVEEGVPSKHLVRIKSSCVQILNFFLPLFCIISGFIIISHYHSTNNANLIRTCPFFSSVYIYHAKIDIEGAHLFENFDMFNFF